MFKENGSANGNMGSQEGRSFRPLPCLSCRPEHYQIMKRSPVECYDVSIFVGLLSALDLDHTSKSFSKSFSPVLFVISKKQRALKLPPSVTESLILIKIVKNVWRDCVLTKTPWFFPNLYIKYLLALLINKKNSYAFPIMAFVLQ